MPGEIDPLRDEREDGGVFERGAVFGVEVDDGLVDLESVIGEDGGEFIGFEPVDVFGAFVGFEEFACRRVEGVAVLAGEEAELRVEDVFGFDGGAGFVGEDEVAIGVPFVLGDIAVEFGVGDEGGEIEPAVRVEGGAEGEEEAGGVGGQLEGEGGDAEGGVGVGKFEGFDLAVVEGGLEVERLGLFPAEFEHVGGEVDAFDVQSVGKEGEEESCGAAAEFEGAAGVEFVKLFEQIEFAWSFFGIPEDIVKFCFEVAVHGLGQEPRMISSSAEGLAGSLGVMRE